VNEAARENLRKKYPGLNIVYTHHGFFQSAEDRRAIAQACADATPRYVFVALGVPGQELWIREFRSLFTSPTAFIGVGGSFDIWSGLKSRAHPIFLKLNLEWLYRITSEPFRLKRVYKTLPFFVVKVLIHDH
jgi:N-acetylglucosaminyldiphosphoundecaprenol N-acetyl-beta-D-mannosaminyltransferase